MQVIELETDLYVAWKCLNLEDAWTDTEIHFALSTKGDYTCLNFKHIGYKEEDAIYATCNYHWARHLFMLKHLCETGHSLLKEEIEAAEIAAVHGE